MPQRGFQEILGTGIMMATLGALLALAYWCWGKLTGASKPPKG